MENGKHKRISKKCNQCYWLQECVKGGEFEFSFDCYTPNEQSITYQDIRYLKVTLYQTQSENEAIYGEWGDE